LAELAMFSASLIPIVPSGESTDSPRLGDVQARRRMGFYDHGDPSAPQCKCTVQQRSATTSADGFDLTTAKPKRGRHAIQDDQTIRGGWQEDVDVAQRK
jgi:hypothetical protein